jgi:hypothetical protein
MQSPAHGRADRPRRRENHRAPSRRSVAHYACQPTLHPQRKVVPGFNAVCRNFSPDPLNNHRLKELLKGLATFAGLARILVHTMQLFDLSIHFQQLRKAFPQHRFRLIFVEVTHHYRLGKTDACAAIRLGHDPACLQLPGTRTRINSLKYLSPP